MEAGAKEANDEEREGEQGDRRRPVRWLERRSGRRRGNEGRGAVGERGGEDRGIHEMQRQIECYQAELIAL